MSGRHETIVIRPPANYGITNISLIHIDNVIVIASIIYIFTTKFMYIYSVSQIKVPPKDWLYLKNQPFDFDVLNAQMS
jgi:hypothetical protein